MKLAVMDPANRDGKLVAHSVSKRTRLGKREVMRIRWHAAAHKTGLPQHEPPVVLSGFGSRHCRAGVSAVPCPRYGTTVRRRREGPRFCPPPVALLVRDPSAKRRCKESRLPAAFFARGNLFDIKCDALTIYKPMPATTIDAASLVSARRR